MKRLILIIMGLFLICPSYVLAVGTVTVTCSDFGNGAVRTLTYSWVGDSSDGSVPSTSSATTTFSGCKGQSATNFVSGYFLCGARMTTTVAHRPTDNYDIYLLDSSSNDLMGGAIINQDSNSTETSGDTYRVPVVIAGSSTGLGCKTIDKAFTFTLSGNSVGSAAGTVTFYFYRPY